MITMRRMRVLFTLAILILSNVLFAQNLAQQKAVIITAVKNIDQNKNAKATSFSIPALKKVLHHISYQYSQDKDGYIKIFRQYSHKNDTTQEAYYFKKGQLIYATETIISYYSHQANIDSSIWKGDFYFANGKLIDHVTLGHGRSETEEWNPEQDVLQSLREAKRDIERYKKIKNPE